MIYGVAFCTALSAIAIVSADIPWVKNNLHVGALLIVIVLGMLWRSVLPVANVLQPGIKFAQRPILRAAVAGLGFKLSLVEISKIGLSAFAVVVVGTGVSLFVGYWIARRLGIGEKLAALLSVGTSVCGASAIVAADSVLEAERAEPAYALGIITLFGTIGILVYPQIWLSLGMNEFQYGVWNGASLHEMAQVVAAGDAVSELATSVATTAKLERILLLAPIVFLLAVWMRKRGLHAGQAKAPLAPWFLVLFVVFAAINSTGWLSKSWIDVLQKIDLWLLCVGMAGVGLQAGFKELRGAGWRPLLAGALQWVLIAAVALVLTKWLCASGTLSGT